MTVPGRPGSVLVIGEVLIDAVIHPGQESVDTPGGAPANVALGLACLDCGVELYCWIGTDERSQAVRSHLEASGVRPTSGADGAARTSTAQVTIGKNRAASYAFDLDWNPPYPTLSDGQASLLVHTGSIVVVLAPGATTMEQMLREARATSTIAYGPNARPQLMGDPKDAREIVERLAGLSDLVKYSDEDIAWLYGRDTDLETVLRFRLDGGVTVVVVTRGKGGVLALSASGVRLKVSADPSVVAVDTVGAGDSFMGGLEDALWSKDLVGMDRRKALRVVDAETPERIIRHAAAIVDTTVSRAGANPPIRGELP